MADDHRQPGERIGGTGHQITAALGLVDACSTRHSVFEEHAGVVRLVLSDLNGTVSRLIGDLQAPIMQATRSITVSPDGVRVVYAQIDPGGADIMASDHIQ